jgi:hypothetical protein
VERLRADVEHLASLRRDSAGEGERASAAWIARRLREAGVEDVHTEPYRGRSTYAIAWIAYLAAGLLGPRCAAWLGLVALELDGSGRAPLVRWPAGDGANVVARIPAAATAERTVVVVAHHDAARTGLMWDPRLTTLRKARNRRIEGYGWPLAAALVLRGLGRTRAARLLGLVNGLLLADVARGETVPGANDNATGVAALLALAEELAGDPLPDADVMLVATGSEESGMDGMRAFLAARSFDPDHTLVVSLDTLGCGTPIVLKGEGILLTHRFPDLVDGVERWRIGGWTDPVLARFAGLPAVSLLSIGPEGTFTHYHHPSDRPEFVDFDCVERCVDLARATVRG